ncbi:serine hydrolase domain-containing protein [Pseudoalteromonas sp. T1lg88]|uniref:serine hydrolase domain-containing protein n=1 Tax=Pseudoalteromonas sp. T1lg88 TaxID=2077104 RepID=UPI0018FEF1B1|nr:serine hydrolase [Pseudoalteromonas sp. T1lg88]
MKRAPLAILLAFNLNTASASLSSEIDSIMDAAIDKDAPGCNLGISHQGQFIHKRGYGLANLELDVPLDGNQVHRMASVSKQFTAMAVLLLVQQGKIDLDQDIRTYLPALREYQSKVSIRQMLGPPQEWEIMTLLRLPMKGK